MSNTKTIARNASWYGLENLINNLSTLITSIAIARYLGPAKLGYMVYVIWIAQMTCNLGGLGIPQATAKYLAEFIGKGDRGTARFIYFRTLLLQICLATVATACIVTWVISKGSSDYRLAALLVVTSIWPAMVNSISAMANSATEDFSKNIPASVTSTCVYMVLILATIILHWGVTGVGAAYFCMRFSDFLVRLIPTMRRILTWDRVSFPPEDLRKRMILFSAQSVATMIVGLIVWSRSEVVLLRYLNKDIRQVAFYSVAFSLADRLLVASTVFGWAAATTIYAQHGRDKSRNADVSASTFRYLALWTIPLHFIAASLAAPALLLLYGRKYVDAVMVVTLAPVLCMPKAFLSPVQGLLQSVERQRFMIFAVAVAGILDVAVAAYLIPAHGAVGACIGSGVAQIVAIAMLWGMAIRFFKIKLPWVQVAKTTFISAVAALTAHFVATQLAPFWGLLAGASAALVIFIGLHYLMRVLEPQDYERFKHLAGSLPKPIAGRVISLLGLLIRPVAANAMSEKSLALKP